MNLKSFIFALLCGFVTASFLIGTTSTYASFGIFMAYKPAPGNLLLENGTDLLLENGATLLLE